MQIERQSDPDQRAVAQARIRIRKRMGPLDGRGEPVGYPLQGFILLIMGRILKLLAPLSVILPMIAGCAPISRYPGPSVSPEHDHAEYWFYNPAGGEQPGMIPVKFMRRYFKTGGNGLPEPRRPVAGRFTYGITIILIW